jgi:hypothetical protein
MIAQFPVKVCINFSQATVSFCNCCIIDIVVDNNYNKLQAPVKREEGSRYEFFRNTAPIFPCAGTAEKN